MTVFLFSSLYAILVTVSYRHLSVAMISFSYHCGQLKHHYFWIHFWNLFGSVLWTDVLYVLYQWTIFLSAAFQPKVAPWSKQKEQKVKKKNRREYKLTKRKREEDDDDDMDDLAKDVRLIKKLKTKKVIDIESHQIISSQFDDILLTRHRNHLGSVDNIVLLVHLHKSLFIFCWCKF